MANLADKFADAIVTTRTRQDVLSSEGWCGRTRAA
jgi:hypothetical protein